MKKDLTMYQLNFTVTTHENRKKYIDYIENPKIFHLAFIFKFGSAEKYFNNLLVWQTTYNPSYTQLRSCFISTKRLILMNVNKYVI